MTTGTITRIGFPKVTRNVEKSGKFATQRAPAPPRYKLALVTWVGAYAVITSILAVLGPMTASWPLPLKTLLLSVLMVLAMTWIVIPGLTRLFRGWLASR